MGAGGAVRTNFNAHQKFIVELKVRTKRVAGAVASKRKV